MLKINHTVYALGTSQFNFNASVTVYQMLSLPKNYLFFLSLQVDKGEEERDIQLSNLLYRTYTHTYNTYSQTSSYVILIALETMVHAKYYLVLTREVIGI